MDKTFDTLFGSASYPCYWLGKDGVFWANEEAENHKGPLGTPQATKKMMAALLAAPEDAAKDKTSALRALRLSGLTVLPLPEGIFACASESLVPPQALSAGLRESIANIFAVLPLLSRRIQDEEGASRYLAEIQSNCYDLLRTASNFENLGTLENAALEMKPIDLTALVEDLAFSVQKICKDQHIPIRTNLPAHALGIRGDSRMLSEAVLNILRNSMQFSRDGNEIRIQVRQVGQRAVLTIEDKGLGIQPENLTHIFEPYFSRDPYGDGAPAPGLGLGLSIVQGIVRAHGGTQTVESRFGEGTSITLSFPLDDSGEEPLYSEPMDYLMNRYSPAYVQLSGYCRVPWF